MELSFAILALAFVKCVYGLAKPCERHYEVAFEADPEDCSHYYWCLGNGVSYRLHCGDLTVWSAEKQGCVHKFSADDKCTPVSQRPKVMTPFHERIWSRQEFQTTTVEPFIQQPYCHPGSRDKFAHPTECGQFYDCAAPASEDIWGRHLRECKYPTVFDDYRKECVHFKRNVCGNRRVPIDPCDYLANQCRTAHCVPCRVRFATCSGMPDGLNPWRGRDNSPFFVFCKDQRVEFHGRCLWPHGPTLLFDPLERKCVPVKV